MTLRRSLMAIAAATGAVLALTACASMRVGGYVAHDVDFTRYQTYDWASVEQFSTGDPRLDNNPFFQERLRATVDRELAARGFERSPARPDFLIHYHASLHERLDVRRVDRDYGYKEQGVDPVVYEVGTLGIDFVDAGSQHLVWRGWAEGAMDGVIDQQAWMEKTIDAAVTRILSRLPRRL